jgi:hypothetical protein
MAPTSLQATGKCIGSNYNLYCHFVIDDRRYTFSQNAPTLAIPNFQSYVILTFNNATNDLYGSYNFGKGAYVDRRITYLPLTDPSGGRQLLIMGPSGVQVFDRFSVVGSGTWSSQDLD